MAAPAEPSLLRFITCGSVDDGKSTLIGRLLYDSHALLTDQLAELQEASRRPGRTAQTLDFASLVDGLADERAQGITIDVAYRFFGTDRRRFIIADTPGHEHYTRNMVTGASTADAAVILVDATRGVVTQTRRHRLIARLLGIRHIALAVNKMDLVGYAPDAFERVVAQFREIDADIVAIPTAALLGDNIAARSRLMPWYGGPALVEWLEQVPAAEDAGAAPFRMPVQSVTRVHGRLACSGSVASGAVAAGDQLLILPGGIPAAVERIVTMDGDLHQAQAGQAVTLVLGGGAQCTRGDLLCAASNPPPVDDRLEATIVWLDREAMRVGTAYGLKIGTRTVTARIEAVRSVIDVNSGGEVTGAPLTTNGIGRCALRLDAAAVAIPYSENRTLGGFILIDPDTHATVAAGLVQAA